jgi:hypothetical protein
VKGLLSPATRLGLSVRSPPSPAQLRFVAPKGRVDGASGVEGCSGAGPAGTIGAPSRARASPSRAGLAGAAQWDGPARSSSTSCARPQAAEGFVVPKAAGAGAAGIWLNHEP